MSTYSTYGTYGTAASRVICEASPRHILLLYLLWPPKSKLDPWPLTFGIRPTDLSNWQHVCRRSVALCLTSKTTCRSASHLAAGLILRLVSVCIIMPVWQHLLAHYSSTISYPLSVTRYHLHKCMCVSFDTASLSSLTLLPQCPFCSHAYTVPWPYILIGRPATGILVVILCCSANDHAKATHLLVLRLREGCSLAGALHSCCDTFDRAMVFSRPLSCVC